MVDTSSDWDGFHPASEQDAHSISIRLMTHALMEGTLMEDGSRLKIVSVDRWMLQVPDRQPGSASGYLRVPPSAHGR